MTISCAILGASGYTGAELMRLLAGHPDLQVELLTASSEAGRTVQEVYPQLRSVHATLQRVESVQSELAACRLVFSCLPHGESMRILPSLENDVLIDLGADFRLETPSDFAEWYGEEHAAPDQFCHWQYGLPELFRKEIAGARRIANPGCYPTAVNLGVAPLLRVGLIEPEIVADCISGISGAGKAPKSEFHFPAADDNAFAYAVGTHRHTAEMEMVLGRVCGRKVSVTFTPHIAPLVRGIAATVSAPVCQGVTLAMLREALHEAYRSERFIEVRDTPPATKWLRGSNFVQIFVTQHSRSGRAIVCVALDNLCKGASGQALQNANLVLGLKESLGLEREGLYP